MGIAAAHDADRVVAKPGLGTTFSAASASGPGASFGGSARARLGNPGRTAGGCAELGGASAAGGRPPARLGSARFSAHSAGAGVGLAAGRASGA
jgi:hypothetical protein